MKVEPKLNDFNSNSYATIAAKVVNAPNRNALIKITELLSKDPNKICFAVGLEIWIFCRIIEVESCKLSLASLISLYNCAVFSSRSIGCGNSNKQLSSIFFESIIRAIIRKDSPRSSVTFLLLAEKCSAAYKKILFM